MDTKDIKKDKKKKKLWGKPKKNEKQARRELIFRLLGNLATLFLAAAIIAGGFFLPSLMSPYVDNFSNNYVQLAKAAESARYSVSAKEPVLYPWDTFDEGRLRGLSSEETSKLSSSGVSDFLIATLQDRGMPLEEDKSFYRQKILHDFRCLESEVSDGPLFFILYEEDLNQDNYPDIRCAVDYDGKIISMIILSAEWDTISLAKPILVDSGTDDTGTENLAGEDEKDGDGEAAIGSNDGTEGNQGSAADNTSTEGADGTANEPANEGDDTGATGGGEDSGGGSGTGDDTSDITGNGDDDATQSDTNGEGQTLPTIEPANMPNQNDMLIWSFSYAASREAHLVAQMDVFNAFRQLDRYYESYYGYGYYRLLPGATAQDEVIPGDPIANTINQPLNYYTGVYRLRIYRLASGNELILYLNPNNMHCVGFHIQQYNIAAS